MNVFDIKHFLSNFFKASDYKSVILILDNQQILRKSIESVEGNIELSNLHKPYDIYYISELKECTEILDSTDFTQTNLIITIFDDNILSGIIEHIDVDYTEKTLYFQNIFSICSGGKYTDEGQWDLKLRHFMMYTTDVVNFLIENYTEYDRVYKNEINDIKNEYLLYFLFCDIPTVEQAKSLEEKNTIKRYYFLEKFLILKSAEIIEELVESKALFLYRVFKEQIRKLFKPSVSNFFLFLVKNGKIEVLINLCIALKIFKEIDKDPNLDRFKTFRNDISPFLDDLDFDLVNEGEVVFSEEFLSDFIKIIANFFEYIIKTGRFKNLKHLFSKFKSAEIILEIEKKKDFFIDELDVDDTKIKEIFSLTQYKYFYSGIVKFNSILFLKLFNIVGDNLERRAKKLNLIAEYRFFISEFKNNIYYKVKLREYILHYKFLKNIIKLFLLTKNLDAIEDESIEEFKLDEWKHFYTNLLLPIDNLCWSTFENSRLFWSYKELPKFMLLLSENITRKVREVNILFLGFLRDNYPEWVKDRSMDAPISVVNVIKNFFKPNHIKYQNNKVDYFLFLIIDCCRVDIWDNLRYYILRDFPNLGSDTITGLSILPTETKFARRALVTGEYPAKHENFTHSVEGKDVFKFFEDNYSREFPKIRRLDIDTKEDILKFYTVNCELLDNNNKAIENLSNELNFQFCVYNFPDIISHNFEISLNLKILKIIYEDKIKPLIRRVLELKTNPVIYFGTDHGIVKCRDKIEWQFSSFHKHWLNNDEYISRKNRYFVSKTEKLKNYREDNLIRIEKNYEKWGLAPKYKEPWIRYPVNIRAYYFGIAYDDLLGAHGENTKKYAHGGASFFELFIPFSILSKNLLRPNSPIEPKILVSEENGNLIANIKNSNDENIKILIFDFYINHYHYLFQNLTIEGKSQIDLDLNLKKLIESTFKFKLKYEFNERVYILRN